MRPRSPTKKGGSARQDNAVQLREAARKEEELLEQQLRERHRYIVGRLRSDIRYFIHGLPEFLELPPPSEAGTADERPRTWDQVIEELEAELALCCAAGGAGASGGAASSRLGAGFGRPGAPACDEEKLTLDPIVELLNFRDKVMAMLLTGGLYQKAVLDLDFGVTSAAGAGASGALGASTLGPPPQGQRPTSAVGPVASISGRGGGATAPATAAFTAVPGQIMEQLTALASRMKGQGGAGGASGAGASIGSSIDGERKYPLPDLPRAKQPGHFTFSLKKQNEQQQLQMQQHNDGHLQADGQAPSSATASVSGVGAGGGLPGSASASVSGSAAGPAASALRGSACAASGGAAAPSQQPQQGQMVLQMAQQQQKERQAAGAAEEKSLFQSRLSVLLREMQSMDRSIRRMKFGKKCKIPSGQTIPCDELRKEIGKVYDKCSRLEHELQMSKAQRHAALDVQVEMTTRKCEDADREIKKSMNRVMKLESDVQALKVESSAIRREKLELAEKFDAIASEHLPLLDQLDKELSKLWDSVDQLIADAQMLSQMFKLQVEEHQGLCKKRDTKAKELAGVNSTLRRERLKNQLKDIELGKKETLLDRTVQARQETKDAYTHGKVRTQEAEERMKKKDEDWEHTQQELEKRDVEISRLQEEMRLATLQVDELEQQKKECMKEFQAAAGRPYAMLIEHCKVVRQAHADEQADVG